MKLQDIFKVSSNRRAALKLYDTVVAQARRKEFYIRLGVPDSIDGRFDMIAVHAFLVLHRLKNAASVTKDLGQEFFDVMFEDMDRNLREMGVGDLGVGKRVKDMAQAFYGRIAAYEKALEVSGDLERALQKNLFRKSDAARANIGEMAQYVRQECKALKDQGTDRIMAGNLVFGPPPCGKSI